ncbi:MAG: DUF664 domain-containing protein [Actinomycetota bacterium]
MAIDALANLDLSRWDQPDPDLEERDLLEGWLRYQRHEFQRKLRDLDREQLARWSVPPLQLSVLGLVRHMTQMEHVFLAWGLGGGERVLRYGEDDFAGGSAATVDDDLRWYCEEVDRGEAALAALPSLTSCGAGHGRPLRSTLIKMIDEYALHAGQAHMLRFAALGAIIR